MSHHGCQSKLVTILAMAAVFLGPMTSDGARNPRQRNNQASYGPYGRDRPRNRQTDHDIDRYYYDDEEEEGSCDIEVACRTETDEVLPPTSMKLPIRGPRGPPGEPGRPGEDGSPGVPGLAGELFCWHVARLHY